MILSGTQFSAAQSAALAPRREVPSPIPGSSSRPADVYFPCWKRGQPAALDVSVISTLQQLTVNGASTIQGHALSIGEERKLTVHAAPCRSVGVSFIPMIVASLGGWSPRAVDVIKCIGRLQGQGRKRYNLETTPICGNKLLTYLLLITSHKKLLTYLLLVTSHNKNYAMTTIDQILSYFFG